MLKLFTGTLLAVAVASTAALAQSSPPAAPAPSAAAEAKFKAADKNGNGTLEGAEVDAFKANLTKIDVNKDGKISRDEFAAASKSGAVN